MAKTRDWTEILVRRGVIGPDQLKEAQRMDSSAIEESLIKLGYAGADDIMKAKAEQHGLPFVELREIEIPPSVIELVPESLARENIVMPLSQESGTIRVIMHDPLDFETIDKLRFVLNREIEVSLAPKEAIVEAINKYYGSATSETESVDSMLQEFTDTAIDFAEDGASGGKSATTNTLEEGDAPVIKLVHLIIQEAVTMRASDIHIEPFADRVRIRYRIDGVLMERDSAPRRLLGAIVSRIKIMGFIDIAEKRRPQDGRIKILVAGKDIDMRVSIIPTSHGQSVVMRILDRDNIKVGLQDLGFGDDDFGAVQATDQTSQWDSAGDGADGLGEDDDAVRRAQRAEPSGREDHHGGRPGRVLLAGREPVRGEGEDRDDVCTHHSCHAAAKSKHPVGG